MSITEPLLSKASTLAHYDITGNALKDCIASLKKSIGNDQLGDRGRSKVAVNDTDFHNYCAAIEAINLKRSRLNTTEAAEKLLPILSRLYDTAFILHLRAEQSLIDHREHPGVAMFKPRAFLARKLLAPGAAKSFYGDQLERFEHTLSDTVKHVLEHEYDCPIVSMQASPTAAAP